MAATQQRLTEEFSVGPARLRLDYLGGEPRTEILEDLNFLNYRLADVDRLAQLTLSQPDVVWNSDGEKSVAYDGRTMTFNGPWPAGPLQKVAVAMLALRLESRGLHPFHASAVRYRAKTVMFLGGESNHGKSMGQIEACRRGGLLVSTETTIVDETGCAVMGSKDVYLKKRAAGTERADKAAPARGVEKFFGGLPTWEHFDQSSSVDVVVVPAIDGNFEPSLNPMIPFERQFQTLHSLQNYFLLNELLAPEWPMPIIDTEPLRRARADFVARFSERPYYFVRAATPQVLMDAVDRVL
ncbi:MAG: hypothetical protein E6I84_13455 [Chloroflexi bacterium]|nr:MAG: hypothetical protein E6J32_10035 [Chloroflexota bacterium]TMD64374.1 MAG: hypothetical protein E6I84_13455 [Chloroflexota bacterium]